MDLKCGNILPTLFENRSIITFYFSPFYFLLEGVIQNCRRWEVKMQNEDRYHFEWCKLGP